jgi:alkylation response protein AidB-like acyl-CoA dehydrogenase
VQFGLGDDQIMVQEAARRFSDARLAPGAGRWDEEKHFPLDVIREAAGLGFAAIYTREEHGGSGLGRLDAAVIFEALSRGCVSTAAFITIHNMATWMVDTFGDAAQRARFVPGLAAMDQIASYCLTEPNAGSDAASLRTTAVRDGEHYVVNGAKAFISGAGVSDLYLVMVRTGGPGPKGISTLVVEKGMPGLSFGANERKMGWNSQPTAQVMFDQVRVPVANRLGAEGDGFSIAMRGLDGGRLNIAACSLGGASAAFEIAQRYVGERQQFGQPLAAFQAVQFRLADMATELEAARTLLYRAASALDRADPDATKLCAMAKRFVTDACSGVANDALQLHGGYGYLKDYVVERIVRDLRVHQILEGANDIMRVIIARELGRGR